MPKTTEIVIHRIEIKKGGKVFGMLWIGKEGISWKPKHGRKATDMTWKQFNAQMTKPI
jgi:hypothetical protein